MQTARRRMSATIANVALARMPQSIRLDEFAGGRSLPTTSGELMSDDPRQRRVTRRLTACPARRARLQVALVLAGFSCLRVAGVVERSPTFDEPMYVLGGRRA